MRWILLLFASLGVTISSLSIAAEDLQRITPQQACRLLEAHTPAPDTAYQPGVDVRGQTVAAADLTTRLPLAVDTDTVTIPLTVDLNEALGIAPAAGLVNEATMGYITVQDGNVAVNGQALSESELRDLAVLCLETTEEIKTP